MEHNLKQKEKEEKIMKENAVKILKTYLKIFYYNKLYNQKIFRK